MGGLFVPSPARGGGGGRKTHRQLLPGLTGSMRPGQLSEAIKALSPIPFKDTHSENVLVSYKARSPSNPTPSSLLRAYRATLAPRGVELPFWVRGFITIPGGVWIKALHREKQIC